MRSIPKIRRFCGCLATLRFKSLFSFSLVLAALAPAAAVAAVASVTPSPSMKPIPISQSTTVSIVWTVLRNNASCGPTVSSVSGTIYAGNPNGPVLMLVPAVLSQTIACPPPAALLVPATNLFTFTESIIVPADVVQRAQKLGFSNLLFVRVFNDILNNPPVAAAVTLPIGGSGAAGFGVTREAMQFEGGAPVRVLPRGETLRALAEIDYAGSGQLQGMWEIAGPTSTAGEAIFRPLSQVSQYLPATSDSKVIASPLLPTDSTGLYLVRLRITDPAPGFDPPIIRYFVTEKSGRGGIPQPLAAYSPEPLALFAADTRFVWQPITGAKAYQLEVYRLMSDPARGLPDLGGADAARPDPAQLSRALARPPVTGMLVPGRQTSTTISGAARLRLEPGQVYVWRVRAIGADGTIVGESAPRELRTP